MGGGESKNKHDETPFIEQKSKNLTKKQEDLILAEQDQEIRSIDKRLFEKNKTSVEANSYENISAESLIISKERDANSTISGKLSAEIPAATSTSAKESTNTGSAAENEFSKHNKQKFFTGSLNNLLNTHLKWSFGGWSSRSLDTRKSSRKSLQLSRSGQIKRKFQLPRQASSPQTQQITEKQQKRSRTVWHTPIKNAIFSTHFQEATHSLEKYEVQQLIGRGSFGIVFKVFDKETLAPQKTNVCSSSQNNQKTYALKVLKKSKIISENSVQQIKDEVDIQKRCGHHPFIVEQFSIWQNRHNLFITLEYMPNGELFSTIKAFSLDLARLYIAEIALAIDFLHNAGVIYRDAKPENILLSHDYHIKLTDFGLSKWLKLGMKTKTLCGTFQYMGTIF